MVSGTINKRKPSPEIFEKSLQALGVKASEAVFVGDTPSMDIKGAKNVGIKAILIQRKSSVIDAPRLFIRKPPEENVPIEPDKTIRSLKELLNALEDC